MTLKPSYDDKLHLSGLSNTEILILALEASQKLEWNIEEITPECLRFEVSIKLLTSILIFVSYNLVYGMKEGIDKRIFSIVMLVYDEEAEPDLEAIASSIQITK